jgi:catalase
LNENAKTYFAEAEQATYNPSHMVLGIEFFVDLVLQSQLFSYSDSHGHRVGVNYQQLPVNVPRVNYRMVNFQRDGNISFFNQGSRPNYLSSIEPIRFRERTVNLDETHGRFTGTAIAFLSEIREEVFNQPRALWEKVFDDKAKERFTKNLSGHMSTCRKWRSSSVRSSSSEKLVRTWRQDVRRRQASRAMMASRILYSTALIMAWDLRRIVWRME